VACKSAQSQRFEPLTAFIVFDGIHNKPERTLCAVNIDVELHPVCRDQHKTFFVPGLCSPGSAWSLPELFKSASLLLSPASLHLSVTSSLVTSLIMKVSSSLFKPGFDRVPKKGRFIKAAVRVTLPSIDQI